MGALIAKLHPLERTVLPVLKKHIELTAIVEASGLKPVEVMRALQWLENKGILKLTSESTKVVHLDKNGELYKKQGLPEKAFLKTLKTEFVKLDTIAQHAKLSKQEVNACIGLLKREKAIDIKKDGALKVKITPVGKKQLQETSAVESFLAQTFPLPVGKVNKKVLDELKKRKDFVKVEDEKVVTIALSALGKKVASQKIATDVVNRLTTGMLKTGSWKSKTLRAYDVEINVPKKHPGRKHFVNEAVEYIKRIWLDMGFKEMEGNYVQSAFWDLDALFVPQDHPAREMQDTFYIKGKAKLPPVWKKIKKVHEDGGDTGSAGWGYTFSEEETAQILLRTHTTVLSALQLAELKKEDLPAKFFSVGKVFRNEALDWKHLFEFYQVDGIVVDPNANLKHLKGYLTQFYKKMGYPKVRMRPAHFPYTSPSLEVDVFHPVKKEWVELGGAGIFRPEVVKPLLGIDYPVLAWGQGMGRIISEYWKITDIRDMYKNDLKQLRGLQRFMK